MYLLTVSEYILLFIVGYPFNFLRYKYITREINKMQFLYSMPFLICNFKYSLYIIFTVYMTTEAENNCYTVKYMNVHVSEEWMFFNSPMATFGTASTCYPSTVLT